MRPYGSDLRRRVVAAYRHGEGSIRDLAYEFEIEPRTLSRWLALVDATGSVEPQPHGGGRPMRLTPVHRQVLQQLVVQDSDATLTQLAKRLAGATGCDVHPTTISRALADLGLTRKKRHSTRRNATGLMSGAHGGRSGGGLSASPATDSSSSTNLASMPR
jgi:transposase